jgi:hypothetical protein
VAATSAATDVFALLAVLAAFVGDMLVSTIADRGPVHANVRAINDWLAISQPDGTAEVVIGPERRPEMTNPTLAFVAGEARDIANLLAIHSGVRVDTSKLDERVRAEIARYFPDDSPQD